MDLSQSLLNSFKPPKIRNANDWANQHARLPPGDAAEGRWKSRRVQEDILKDCSLGNRRYASGQRIREIVVLKAAQCGMTKCLFNVLGYTMAEQPCPCAVYVPNPDSKKTYAGNLFAKWLSAQPSLEGIVSSEISSDGKSSLDRKIFRGGVLSFLSASLPRDVASHTLRLILNDEVDSFPDYIKNEGKTIDLIRNRAKEYASAILVWSSTPRGTFQESKIWQLYNEESDQCRFMVKCPKCGKLQYLSHNQFRVRNPYSESGMECIQCNYLIQEHDKAGMLQNGFWQPNPKANGRPGVRGYHLSAFLSTSPVVSWPAIARMREAAGYDKQALISFLNTTAGIPASNSRDKAIKPTEIIDHAKNNSVYKTIVSPEEPIPNDISYITVGVDCQSSAKNGRLEVQFWGFSRDRDYFLNHCELPGNPFDDQVWEGLQAITDVFYRTEDKLKQVKPSLVLIDSGEGRLANRVYSVCRTHRLWQACKGHSIANKNLVMKQKIPANNQIYYSIQVSEAKDDLHMALKSWLDNDPDGRLRLPDDIDPYVAQGFCSEYRTVRRVADYDKVLWIHDKKVPNEPLDAAIYARAAARSYLDLQDPYLLWPRLDKLVSVKRERKKVKRVFGQTNWGV